MKVPVRVAGPGREVAYDSRFDLLHGDLRLPTAWADARRRVRGQPADDLLGRRQLRGVVRLGDLGMERRRERPGLRPVHCHLDEPHRSSSFSSRPLAAPVSMS